MTKSALPEGYRYRKAHTSKWAIFYGLNEMVGWVRKVKKDLRGCGHAYWYQLMDDIHSQGPFDGKDEAGLELIKRWEL